MFKKLRIFYDSLYVLLICSNKSITKNLSSKINRIRYITCRTCVDIVLTLLKQSRVRSIYFCNQKMAFC